MFDAYLWLLAPANANGAAWRMCSSDWADSIPYLSKVCFCFSMEALKRVQKRFVSNAACIRIYCFKGEAGQTSGMSEVEGQPYRKL